MKAYLPFYLAAWIAIAFTWQQVDLGPRDYVEYWSAARVLFQGGNPYDGTQLLPFQREATNDPELEQAVSLWTPPWSLPFYLPFGALSMRWSHPAWVATQLTLILLSCHLLWLQFGGAAKRWMLSWLIALLFSPVLWLAHFGQNTGYLVFGIAGFLHYRERRPIAAGLCVALTAIKPHLLALFGLALLGDCIHRGGRRIVGVGIITLIVGISLTFLFNQHLIPQYIQAVQKPTDDTVVSLTDWQLPLLSYQLRHWIDPNQFRWQFLPIIFGMGLTTIYWTQRRKSWDWTQEAPRLVLLSLLLAPYGGWLFDLTLLLIPSIALLIRLQRLPAVIQASVGIAWLLLSYSGTAYVVRNLHDPIWFTPALIALFVLVRLAGSSQDQQKTIP